MGQFGNQPDFAKNIIQKLNTITNNINQSTFLDYSIIYIGYKKTYLNQTILIKLYINK